MSYQDKMDRASALIQEHNEAIGKESKEETGHINSEHFVSCIKLSGGTSEDRLKSMSYEDILDCLPNFQLPGTEKKVKPKALAKAIASAWRDRAEFFCGLDLVARFRGRPASGERCHRQYHLDRGPHHPSLRRFGLFNIEGSLVCIDARDGGRVCRAWRKGQCRCAW